MHTDGNDHGAGDSEGSDAGEEAEDQSDAAAELGESGESLQNARDRGLRSHPIKWGLDFSPTVENKGIPKHKTKQEKSEVHCLGLRGC